MTTPASERPEHYWFARHSTSIVFLICMLAIVGVYEALTLPVAVFPTTNFPRIIIGVDNGVMPIEQMEVSITRPLEGAVRSVPGLENVRSVTSRGSAEIDLFFNWTVDMRETLHLVDAAVSNVQRSLPSTAQVQTHRLDFASFPIIGYSLTSEAVPQTDLWELATYDIKPRLNSLPGVASVLIHGGHRPEFHVTVDPAQMLRAKTSVADIVNAINHTNVVDSPGLLNRNHQLFLALVDGQAHGVEDVGNIVIKHVNNVPVRVRDVGTVAPATEPVYTVVSANGKPAVLLSVNRQPDSNTVQVADEVHKEMAAIQPSLPAGVEMRPFYDQSNIVNESIAAFATPS
jgi:Cation/multidrug efflux pump